MADTNLLIPVECMQKLAVYTDAVKGEISGLFTVKATAENHFLMTDIFLLDQESTGGGTELSVDGQTDLLAKLAEEGRYDVIEDLKGWWHSHGTMGVFWSGTDTHTQDIEYKPEYLVSLVVNKKHEMKAKLSIYYPIPIDMDLTPAVAWAEYAEKDVLIEEVKEKVKEPKPKTGNAVQHYKQHNYYGWKGNSFNNWEDDDDTDGLVPTGWNDCPHSLSYRCKEKSCLSSTKKCNRFQQEKSKSIHDMTEEEIKKLGVVVVDSDDFSEMTDKEIEDFLEAEQLMQDNLIEEDYKDYLKEKK
jgi:hypothetical protein